MYFANCSSFMTKLSFILPAYKRRYLPEAIQSILAQTFTGFELVVVDDCSPEDLHEVIAGFSDERLKYLRNERNIGGQNLVANWNRCLGLAKGEYCVLASDDDVYAPNFAEKMLACASRHPEVDVIHCRIAMIDSQGKTTKISENRPQLESCADFLYARGVRRCLQTAPEFMFKTKALQEAGGFVSFPAAWYSDDATWALLAREKGVAFVPEVLFKWRYSGENISSRVDVTEKKIKAAEEYKEWLRNFIAAVPVSDGSQRAILDFVSSHIYESVDQQSLFDLDDTRFLPWFKILGSHILTRRLMLRSVRNRLRRMVGLS